MSVKLIAENILDADDFYSATEQEGECWGQPEPASDNAGSFRPVTDGTPADLTYSGTATSDGAGDGTTVIDSALAVYGDDYLIGATLAITSGDCNGESQTVTDFAQATGTLTTAAFSAQVVSGVTFTLTLPFDTRSFKVELISSGDAGDATFKWTHDGGTTYLGRDSPNQATWLAERQECDGHYGSRINLIDAGDGVWLLFYNTDATTGVLRRSTDRGMTWGDTISVSGGAFYCAAKLNSGRIIVVGSASPRIWYSDDTGLTWSTYNYTFTGTANCVIELPNGNIAVFHSNNSVYCSISTDGGQTFASDITVASDANEQDYPYAVVAVNGDVVCVYQSDEDSANDEEIKCRVSSDNCATWGSAIDVMDFGATDIIRPALAKDLNGDLYCVAMNDSNIIYSRSTDNGSTWGAQTSVINVADTIGYPNLALMDGHQMVCACCNSNDAKITTVRRGIWEAFSANACPVATEANAQHLVCDAEVSWYGGAGIAGDDWSFDAEYDFAMENIIEDSPSKPWRSEQDNIACNIVFYKGSNAKHYVDGVAFFGCNVRTLSFQMNATNAWGAPSVDETISFDLTTDGVLDAAADENYIKDAALMANYKDHELKDCYVRFTSGALDGYTYKILDNVGDYIVLEEIFAFNDQLLGPVATDDTFIIFQDHVAKTFTGGLYQYMRIAISAQRTSPNEAYYQIGMMIAGKSITLTDAFSIGYDNNIQYGIELLQSPGGSLIPINHFNKRRQWKLGYTASDSGRKEVVAMLNYLEGKNIALILDSADLTDTCLVKLKGAVEQAHVVNDYFALEAEFEEVI